MKTNACYVYFPLILLLSGNCSTPAMENSNTVSPITNNAVHQIIENSSDRPHIVNIDSLSVDDSHDEISKNIQFPLKFLAHIDELTNLVADGSKLMYAFSDNPEQQETLEKLETLSKKINSKTNLIELLGQDENFDTSLYNKSGARFRLKTTYQLINKLLENPRIQKNFGPISATPYNPACKLSLSLFAVEKIVGKKE